ncbi:unannotated protein [freshwater metagenome]|uniref:Unannotated protein n=1 Tax=freshwater metagenome TaxID=449393 RepID=A0A6J7H1V0_9ZZZZ
MRLADSVIIPSDSHVHVGDVTVTQGSVSDYSGGKIGTFTLTETVVDPKYAGDNEARIARATFVSGSNALFGETLVIAKHRDRPQASWYMAVVGGIGNYRSATGNMTLMRMKRGWRLAFDLTLESTPLRQNVQVVGLASTDTASDRPGGLGATTATTGSVQGGGAFLASAVTVARGDTANSRTTDASITLPNGTVLLRGLLLDKRDGKPAAASYAILGGTGEYLGVRGDARIVPQSPTRTKIALTYTRLSDGKPESPTITATTKGPIEGRVIGAIVSAEVGTLNGKDDRHRTPTGKYDLIQTTFLPVGDISVMTVAGRYELSGGSLIVGGVGIVGEETQMVILGGTSEYAGSRGTATFTQIRRGVVRINLTLWRGGVGPVG